MFAAKQREVPAGTTLPNGLVALEIEGSSDRPFRVQASKAELCLLSSVLREAFVIEPDCQTLKVEGTSAAWHFAASYLSRTTAERTAAFDPFDDGDREQAANLLTAVLAVAKQYDMPLLMKECIGVVSSWGKCSDIKNFVGVGPAFAGWWIDLAEQYGELALAAPALKALISDIREGNDAVYLWNEIVWPCVTQRGAVLQVFGAIIDNCIPPHMRW